MPQNWWVNTSPANISPGGATVGGGGYGVDGVTYRSELDARRVMAGRDSQYPDGYLGTITDRQQDKLLAKVQEKLSERSYQRGVHVGSKVGMDSYFWNQILNPDMGLARQARAVVDTSTGAVRYEAMRFAPTLDPVERLAHMGKTAAMSAPELDAVARKYGVDPAKNLVVNPDPMARDRYQKMLPRYAV